MQKTSNYNLNKPEPNDPLRVEDFNENADIIDGALTMLGGERVIVGSYEGDDMKNRVIELPFTPKLVIQLGNINSYQGITITTPGISFLITTDSCSAVQNTCIVENGFETAITATLWHNTSGKTEHYVAIR